MKTIVDTNKKPKVPYDSWKVHYHNHMGKVDVSNLVLHLEEEQKTGYIKGEVLAERLKDKSLNANVLDFLLENPSLIPDDWKGKYVYFWGTIYRLSDDDLCVRYLCWRVRQWGWGSGWLDRGWRSRGPAALLASPRTLETKNSLESKTLELRVKKLERILNGFREVIIKEN